MGREDESKEDRFQWQALMSQASRFTYCLHDRTNNVIGTAIAIRLGERHFFATAKHVIYDSNEFEVISRGSIAPVLASDFQAKCSHPQIDVGLLELRPHLADHFDFADRTQMQLDIDEDRELPTLIVGYPSQFIHSVETKLTTDDWLRIHGCAALTFRSVALPRPEWPDNHQLEDPLVCGRDLLVDFQPEAQVRRVAPGISLADTSEEKCPRIDPHGISGGGIWLANVEDRNGLHVPNVRLLGIQTGWYKQGGWLRGVRIQEWLTLVESKYPE